MFEFIENTFGNISKRCLTNHEYCAEEPVLVVLFADQTQDSGQRGVHLAVVVHVGLAGDLLAGVEIFRSALLGWWAVLECVLVAGVDLGGLAEDAADTVF